MEYKTYQELKIGDVVEYGGKQGIIVSITVTEVQEFKRILFFETIQENINNFKTYPLGKIDKINVFTGNEIQKLEQPEGFRDVYGTKTI